jgi:hypothetical protein
MIAVVMMVVMINKNSDDGGHADGVLVMAMMVMVMQ